MENNKKRFSLQCTKNTTKIYISIQNFNNAKKIQKMENCQNTRKFHVVFVKNHKMLIVKMHKKEIQKKFFCAKCTNFQKIGVNSKKPIDIFS